ncbi:MAG: hypothetical protein GC134_05065 [Proteobacteria bacterium]|nr:hypothetical protein [Pseudomonadota bacterium]
MMAESEKRKLRTIRMIGPKVVNRLEKAGFKELSDFVGMDAIALYNCIRTACAPIWMVTPHPMAVSALQNLIDAANAAAGGGTDTDLFPHPFI